MTRPEELLTSIRAMCGLLLGDEVTDPTERAQYADDIERLAGEFLALTPMPVRDGKCPIIWCNRDADHDGNHSERRQGDRRKVTK